MNYRFTESNGFVKILGTDGYCYFGARGRVVPVGAVEIETGPGGFAPDPLIGWGIEGYPGRRTEFKPADWLPHLVSCCGRAVRFARFEDGSMRGVEVVNMKILERHPHAKGFLVASGQKVKLKVYPFDIRMPEKTSFPVIQSTNELDQLIVNAEGILTKTRQKLV